jgi:hypothetical protein
MQASQFLITKIFFKPYYYRIITYGTKLHNYSQDVEWFDYIVMTGNFLRSHIESTNA